MRVVAGTAKGRKLKSVPGSGTRPILDRVKTALFDILRPSIQDALIFDMFAGSGAVGIEALSQGAAKVIFTDSGKAAVETIKQNLATTEFNEKAEVRHTDAFTYLRNTSKSFDLIYVAPPQYKGLWVEAVHMIAERPEKLKENGQVVVQIDPKEYEELILNSLREVRQKKYGNTLLLFFNSVVSP